MHRIYAKVILSDDVSAAEANGVAFAMDANLAQAFVPLVQQDTLSRNFARSGCHCNSVVDVAYLPARLNCDQSNAKVVGQTNGALPMLAELTMITWRRPQFPLFTLPPTAPNRSPVWLSTLAAAIAQ